jgi:hypothetical protein
MSDQQFNPMNKMKDIELGSFDNNNFDRRNAKKQKVIKLIDSDRKELEKWTHTTFAWKKSYFGLMNGGIDFKCSGMTVHDELGGAQLISLKLQNILIDEDGDLNVSDEELAASEDKYRDMVDQALNLMVNSGVVGALIFSVLYGILFTYPESSDSLKFFGYYGFWTVFYIYYTFILAALVNSMALIYHSARMYLHLSMWMPTLELKVWYITKISLVPIIEMSMSSVVFSGLAIPFGVAVFVTPLASLFAIIAVGVCAYSIWHIEICIGPSVLERVHAFNKEYFQEIGTRKKE